MKVINKRPAGKLFHYSHFIMDCLFPEILAGVLNHAEVYRPKTRRDTLGIFHTLYEDITGIKNIELTQDEYNQIKEPTREIYRIDKPTLQQINIFRNYIFSRYKIHIVKNPQRFPKIILIKRGYTANMTETSLAAPEDANDNGCKRREIHQIDRLSQILKQKHGNDFEVITLEGMPYRKQILYFKYAKYIIGIHGAAFANLIYGTKGATLIEVLDTKPWPWVFMNHSIKELGIKKRVVRNNFNDIQILVNKTII